MKTLIALVLTSLITLSQAQTNFNVHIENLSTPETLSTSTGTVPVPLAPGVWVIHQDGMPLFTLGEQDYGHGLEALAEDGDPSGLITSLTSEMMSVQAGVFNTPVGADGAGPLLPGGIYEFSFTAEAGDRLSFATMFVQSNDWFYAPSSEGVALFNDAGEPLNGEVTVSLWDAGTEVDEEAGVGEHQAPRQMGPNNGEAQNAPVSLVGELMTSGAIVKVTITAMQ